MSAHPLRPVNLASTPREVLRRVTRGQPLAVGLIGLAVVFMVSLAAFQGTVPAPAQSTTATPAASLALSQEPLSTLIRPGVLAPRRGVPPAPKPSPIDQAGPPAGTAPAAVQPASNDSASTIASAAGSSVATTSATASSVAGASAGASAAGSSPAGAGPAASAAAAAGPGASSQGGGVSLAAALDEGIAKALLERYYTAVNERDYQAAYELVTSKWRQRQGYPDFAGGYSGTRRDTLTVLAAGPASQGGTAGYVLSVDVVAETTSGRTQHFNGLYFVIVEGDQPKIDSGRLTPVLP